jgi:NTE family protein
MSCTIPFFFTPVKMKYDGGLSYIVDGGLLSSFPIWIFDMEGKMDRPTFGIKIKDPASNTSRGKTGLISYLKDIIDTPINKDEEYFIRDKDSVRTIVLDYDGTVHPTDFGSVHKHRGDLFKKGYDSTMEFLNKWDYNRYKEMFIKKSSQ